MLTLALFQKKKRVLPPFSAPSSQRSRLNPSVSSPDSVGSLFVDYEDDAQIFFAH
jgi:hypothetical protein